MTVEQRPAPQYSALQLAWLQELGVEKPWLPVEKLAAQEKAKALITQVVPTEVSVSVKVAPAPAPAPVLVPALPASLRRQAGAARQGAIAGTPAPMPAVQVDTQAVAQSAVDLQTLAKTVNACQACGLCQERQQTVFGEGVMQPAIMVIGEAPGEHEDRQGKPFVDRMGLMLDNMLTSIQSSRAQNVYVCNIVKCRPPGNRNPKPEELAACKPYLLKQIALVKPFAIFAVGRVAAQVLLETDAPLLNLRQVTHHLSVDGLKIPLIVSHHPANLLNHSSDKAAAWQDLQLVRTVAGL